MDVTEITGVLKEGAHHILTTILGIRKLSAKSVPRLLIADKKMYGSV